MSANFGIQLKVWLTATVHDPGQFFLDRRSFTCACCSYTGYFATAKRSVPVPFRCPNCESRPRDRQISLWLKCNDISLSNKDVIHFAPEWPLFRMLKHEPGYVGGDILKRRNSNAMLDITAIQFPDNSFDFLICNHVLEHVLDDRKGMAECFRVLKQGSVGIFTVPLSGRSETWVPPPDMPVSEVEKICGWDHERFYGNDFADQLQEVGFQVARFECNKEDREAYCLSHDTLFIARKP